MSDIVALLRAAKRPGGTLCRDAADEIDRLRSALSERIRRDHGCEEVECADLNSEHCDCRRDFEEAVGHDR